MMGCPEWLVQVEDFVSEQQQNEAIFVFSQVASPRSLSCLRQCRRHR
jgi:hypothetical protein